MGHARCTLATSENQKQWVSRFWAREGDDFTTTNHEAMNQNSGDKGSGRLNQKRRRHDLTEGLKKLPCKTLIFVGDCSPFHTESVYMNAMMEKKICALVEVQSCGSLVTEEHPYAMLIPIEFFLMGFGLYRQQLPLSAASSNGSNPAKPPSLTYSCIAPELLSPESLGIKLKPIKTRATIEI